MAYEFNGTSQSLQTASAPVSILPITMACWFNSTSDTSSQTLISMANSTGAFGGARLIAEGSQAGDPIRADYTNSGGSGFARTTSGYTANKWHHACGVYTSTSSRSAYLDGGSSATDTSFISPQFESNALTIAGRFNNGTIGLFAVGRIAEVGIWNAALTAAEVASLAKGMTCDKVRPQNLVFYAPLVRVLIDQKGGRTITNNNGATVANHPRVYA
jgi:hypothetical protein